jgi:hypothetical protein
LVILIIRLTARVSKNFRNNLIFYGERLFPLCPTPIFLLFPPFLRVHDDPRERGSAEKAFSFAMLATQGTTQPYSDFSRRISGDAAETALDSGVL